MSRSKPARARHSNRTPAAVPPVAGDDLLFALLKLLVAALLIARWLTPTEAAVDGDTLWMVQLWLAAGLLWGWRCFREGDYRIRVDRLDLFLWVLIAGHVISAIWVIVDGGQKRAAVNMLWEWIGLGVTFFLVRQVLQTSLDRQRMTLAVVATVACLAVLGIWQHYVFYPRTTFEYETTRNELSALQSAEPAKTPDEAIVRQQQIRDLTARLAEQGIPLEGTSRALWESRLRASSEPFGLFALANSFAGLLVVGLIVSAGLAALAWKQGGGRVQLVAPCAVMALILYCVVLTKSRTAWCGLAVGGATWCALSLRRRVQTVGRKGRLALIGGVVTIVAAFALAGLSGGFDWQVVSEAPKSLSYRMQYWRGTWNVLRERPVLGAGPGNFRQHYLKHKLPESSEEIADPHNMLLDVWSSGGLIALGGLAGFIVCAFRAGNRSGLESPAANDLPAADAFANTVTLLRHPSVIGAAAGFGLVWSVSWLFGEFNPADYRFTALPLMLVGYLVLVALLGRSVGSRMVPATCLAAAGLALLTHLLGSGGIEMPAIAQTLLLLPALAGPAGRNSAANPHEIPTTGGARGVLVMAAAALVLFIACFWTATAPVIQSRALVARGEDAQRRGNLEQAKVLYRAASVRDPFSPQPVERLARVWFDRWLTMRQIDDGSFEKAVELQQLAIELDPHNWLGFQTLGQWHELRYSQSGDKRDAQKGAEFFAQAIDRYPASSGLRAELAEALDAAGKANEARRQAENALELDEINHQAGHSDKYLPDNVLQRLHRLKQGQ